MCKDIKIGNFIAQRQDDGTFLYKAKKQKSLLSKKKYKEKPQHKLIEQYEQKSLHRYQQHLKNTTLQVVSFIKKAL